jgi:hypothetical protein
MGLLDKILAVLVAILVVELTIYTGIQTELYTHIKLENLSLLEDLNFTNTSNNSIFVDELNKTFKTYPKMNKFPKNYYEVADGMYPDVKVRDIRTLYIILKNIKLPAYKEEYYDCSEASAQLEWILEGYGFKAYIAESPNPPPGDSLLNAGHMWVIVELDNGDLVAIESTYLTKNHYHPPGIIMGNNRKYLEYSYLYQMYLDYLNKYSNGNYILPKNFDDFIGHYLNPPIDDNYLNALSGYYYNPSKLYDNPEEYVLGERHGDIIYYIPISQFDWWNHPENKHIKELFKNN